MVEEQPDAALIAGDFLYSSSPSVAVQVEHVMRLLAPLVESGIPTYAVLGNPGLTDVDAALADVPDGAPRIVMMHDAPVFDRLPASSAPLAVAGHTHCGQIAVPGAPRWSYLALTAEERIVADGWAPAGYGADRNAMSVTCGIGFSIVPVRIGAAPQVVFFELTGAA